MHARNGTETISLNCDELLVFITYAQDNLNIKNSFWSHFSKILSV